MTLATAAEAMKQLALTARDRIQQEYYLRDERKALHYSVAVVFPILLSFAFSSTGLASLIVSLWHLALRIVGTSLGIGLGLGLAGHVASAVREWHTGFRCRRQYKSEDS